MSADVLRSAAAILRERAEAATPGIWESIIEGRDHLGGDSQILTPGDDTPNDIGIYVVVEPGQKTWRHDRFREDQDYIASMNPQVGACLANLFDKEARAYEKAASGTSSAAWLDERFAGVTRLAETYLGLRPKTWAVNA